MEQTTSHNHLVSEEIYKMLKHNQIIPSEMLLGKVSLLQTTHAPMRDLAALISSEAGA